MEVYKYSALIDCKGVGCVQRFESNDFDSFHMNIKLLEDLLSELKVTYSVYFNGAFWNEYLDEMKYEKNNHSEE